jgi:hypothetical protein
MAQAQRVKAARKVLCTAPIGVDIHEQIILIPLVLNFLAAYDYEFYLCLE